MSSETLFKTDYTTIESVKEVSKLLNEPQWLLDRRLKAYETFENLPIDKDTLFYKYTSFRKFDPKTLEPVWKSKDTEKGEILLDLPIASKPHLIETSTGIQSNLPVEWLEKGVIFDSIHNLIKSNEGLAQRLVEKVSAQSADYDKLGLLSRALATNICVLYVPKGITITEPIIKLIISDKSSKAQFAEFIGIFEENSSITLIEILHCSSKESIEESLYSTLHSVYLHDNSIVKGLTLQDWNAKFVHISAKNAKLERYSSLRTITHLQGAEMSRHNSSINLSGQGSEAYDLFIKFGSETQRYDIKSELRHNGKDTIGQTHARTVMIDKSESILRGLIVIPESGINADSWLTSKGMTMGKGKINAVPSLEILQNDVKAAHAASVEPLNAELIFYLTCRGIPANVSKEMLVKGYFEPVLKLIKQDEIVDISKHFLSKKWESLETTV
ncbi:MAG: SufD family Fe-S cluster assembly protein [Candidatus Kariarchaeaceae archaeon]|jgi:Fe-S cluster assembly scaffold protein SufB